MQIAAVYIANLGNDSPVALHYTMSNGQAMEPEAAAHFYGVALPADVLDGALATINQDLLARNGALAEKNAQMAERLEQLEARDKEMTVREAQLMIEAEHLRQKNRALAEQLAP